MQQNISHAFWCLKITLNHDHHPKTIQEWSNEQWLAEKNHYLQQPPSSNYRVSASQKMMITLDD